MPPSSPRVSLQTEIIANAAEGVYLVRVADGSIVFCNPRFEQMFGYGPGELLGRPVAIINDPHVADPQAVAQSIMAELAKHGSWRGEVRNVKKDGTRFWTEASISTFDHADFGPVWVTIQHDIDARKRKELELVRIYDVPRVLMLVVSLQDGGRILRVGEGARGILGYAPEEMVGRPFYSFIHPEDLPDSEVEATMLLSEGQTLYFENRYRHSDGHYVALAWAASVDSESGLTYGLAQDITARRAAEEALLSANIELDERVRARTLELEAALADREMLLREIHHRVKNNLQVVSSLLHLQKMELTDEAARGPFVESEHRVQSMALLHEQLYGSRDLRYIDLPDYVDSLVVRIEETFASEGCQVAIRPRVAPVVLDIDQAIPLGLVLTELLTNAFKYAYPGGSGEVWLELDRRGSHARVAVRDQGPGLPADFDLEQAPSLGLRLVRSLVVQLGGRLHAEPGPGTHVHFDFPIADIAPATE
ncbi:MAG: PAS domain S-box protein [Myxococcales bacterium]|nr:PAS domain S-box protein [Myxococcales bacterium]